MSKGGKFNRGLETLGGGNEDRILGGPQIMRNDGRGGLKVGNKREPPKKGASIYLGGGRRVEFKGEEGGVVPSRKYQGGIKWRPRGISYKEGKCSTERLKTSL